MKVFSRLPVVILVFVASILMSVGFSTWWGAIAQTPTSPPRLIVPMSLPDDATVQLSGNRQRRGRIMGLDPQQQVISLGRGRDSASMPLREVQRITFNRASQFYRASGPPVIRGEQASPTGPQATWNAIRINGFRVAEPNRGRVEVDLSGSALTTAQIRGIRSVAINSTYVTDEMRFDLSRGTMTLVVTPY